MDRSSLFLRFPLRYRIEHWILAVNFTLIAFTGLVQFFADATFSQWVISLFGGIENVRHTHHVCAIIMIAQTLVHLGVTQYRAFMTLKPSTIAPGWQDAVNAMQAYAYNFGLSKEKPKEGRYTFAEKAEYWAVIWGTVIMAVTGFMMWNPVATTKILPGEVIPAAKVAHGLEAILAVLAIIVWHFYFVLIKHLNTSMFTGYMTEKQMMEDHPLELADIRFGLKQTVVDPAGKKRFWQFLFPQYLFICVIIMGWVIWFAYFEKTSVEEIVPPENVTIFSPTTEDQEFRMHGNACGDSVDDISWDSCVSQVFTVFCNGCHGIVSSRGNLDLTSYDSMMESGVVVPGNPDASRLLRKLTEENHVPDFPLEEITRLYVWLVHGAPETTDDEWVYPSGEPMIAFNEDGTEELESDDETEDATSLTWASGIAEIFEESCVSCHGTMQLGGLDLSTYDALMDSGAVVPGNASGSNLIQKMEVGTHQATLSADKLETVRNWIEAGAPAGDIVPEPVEEEVDEPEELDEEPEEIEEPAEVEEFSEGIPEFYWDTDIGEIFQDQCASCHGAAAMGGLDVRTYDSLMDSDLIVSGDPDASPLVEKIEVEGHPGTLSSEDLSMIRAWIWNNAPEFNPASGGAVEEDEEPEPAEEPEPVEEPEAAGYTWTNDIFAFLDGTCTGCHGAGAMGDVDLTSYSSMMDSGVMAPGDPDGSRLVTAIRDGSHFAQLSDEEIQMLIDWIISGAAE